MTGRSGRSSKRPGRCAPTFLQPTISNLCAKTERPAESADLPRCVAKAVQLADLAYRSVAEQKWMEVAALRL